MAEHRRAKAAPGQRFDQAEIDAVTFTDGGDNVFADLGLPDAADRLARAEMARAIRQIVQEKGWNPRRVATALGIAASAVSDLFRGKLTRFSRERLERFLNTLDAAAASAQSHRAHGDPRLMERRTGRG